MKTNTINKINEENDTNTDLIKVREDYLINCSISQLASTDNNKKSKHIFIELENAKLKNDISNKTQYIIKLEREVKEITNKYQNLELSLSKRIKEDENSTYQIIIDKINYNKDKLEQDLVNYKLKFAEKSEESLKLQDEIDDLKNRIVILIKLASDKDKVINELTDKISLFIKENKFSKVNPFNQLNNLKSVLYTDTNNPLDSTDYYSNANPKVSKTAGDNLNKQSYSSKILDKDDIMSVNDIIKMEKEEMNNSIDHQVKYQPQQNIKLSNCLTGKINSNDILNQVKQENKESNILSSNKTKTKSKFSSQLFGFFKK